MPKQPEKCVICGGDVQATAPELEPVTIAEAGVTCGRPPCVFAALNRRGE